MAPGTLRAPGHLARHPFGRVPVLEHDNFSVHETQAILRYLDRALPDAALTPEHPRLAARMDQVMNVNDWYLFQGVANVIVFQRIVGPRLRGLTPDEAAIEAAMPKGRAVCAELARLLGDQSWFAGDALSLADLLVAPQLDFLAATPEWPMLRAGHGDLITWLEWMNRRASMQATTWEKVAALSSAAGR